MNDDHSAPGPWTQYGRIATMVAVGLGILDLILTYLIFVAESFAQGEELDAAGMFYLFALGAFILTGLAGPAMWIMGLRRSQEALWPPLLLLGLFVVLAGIMLKMFSNAITYGPLF